MCARRSLVGPLVILGLGVLFLVKNLHPEIPAWEMVWKYWPALLVVWGLALLGRALRPRPAGAPLERPALTVGEFFLILLFLLIGTAIYKGRQHGFHVGLGDDFEELFGETYTYSQEVRQAVEESQPGILVVNPGGEIRVMGSDTAEVEVKAQKRVKARSENDAKNLQGLAQVEISREGSKYVVRSNSDRARGGRPVRVALEVHVPRAAALELQVQRGDVQVSEVSGPVTVSVDSAGDVSLADIGGKVKVALRRGSLSAQRLRGSLELDGRGRDIQVSDVQGEVVVRGDYTGAIAFSGVKQALRMTTSRTELEVQKLPGKVDMTIGALTITDPVGSVNISTRAKDIRIEEFQGPVQIVNRDATVELRTSKLPLQNIDVDNRSGKIELAVPSSSQFQIDAAARRGDVNSDFPVTVQKETEAGILRGEIGKNGPTIKLNTTFGTIYLRKVG